MQALTDCAQALYAFMRREYLRSGYMYSGNVNRSYALAQLGIDSAGFSDALDELVAAALAQQRDCDALCWELTIPVRYQLILHHGLAERWERDAHCFYPNQPTGEVGRVIQRVADLCCDLAQRLLQLEALCPDDCAPQGVRWAIAMPLERGRMLRLATLAGDGNFAEHTLQVLQCYLGATLLATLQRVPVAQFAADAAALLIGEPRPGGPPLEGGWATRWEVPCLFPDPAPCLVCASRGWQDPNGWRARARAEQWRKAVAATIEEARRALAPASPDPEAERAPSSLRQGD